MATVAHGRGDAAIRVAVFDLGNVLIGWDPRPAIAAGVGEAEAAAFLADPAVDFAGWNLAQDAGRPWDEAEALLAEAHPHRIEAARSYRRHFARSLTGPVPGVPDLLAELAAAGRVRLAALTNWSAELFPIARETFDFLDLFETIVVSGEEGLAKPDPRLFERLAERLGEPLTACFFVDDSPANVAAAAGLGMDAVRFVDAPTLRRDLHTRGLLPIT